MEVDGKKLIDLLMQALEEGDTVRFTEITNRLLAYKVSECLGDQRVLIAEQLFVESSAQDEVEAEFRDVVRQLDKLKGVKSSAKKKLENRLLSLDKKKALARLGLGEDLADLVKVSNLNRDDDSDAADPDDEVLPNSDLARIAAEDDELRNFDEVLGGPKFKVGDAVDVEVGFGKFQKGKVTKVGPRKLDGVWVKITKTKKTTNFPIGLVSPQGQRRKIVDEGGELRNFDEGFEVGDMVEVKLDNGKFKKGKVTKVGRLRTRGRTRNEGVWVEVGGKTEQFPIGVVRKLKEGRESVGLDTFR